MKKQLKLLVGVVGAALVVVATVFSAFAERPSPGLARATVEAAPASADPRFASGSAAACTKMQASEVGWFTLTDEGDVDLDNQVESYPSDTTTIAAVFQYNCVPKKTTIVTVFTLDGEQVFSDKEAVKASNSKGLYPYTLGTTDNSALPDGTWGVEFYNNKTKLAEGTVVVGEESGQTTASTTVTVEGTVTDKKTKKPIKGATILVLNPGVTIKKFIDRGQKDADVLTGAQTDSKGKFVVQDPIERNTEYSLIVVAKGYKPVGQDGLTIGDDDPDPLELTVTMTK